MSWEYIDFSYPQSLFFHKILLWASSNFNMYFALKLNADDVWSFYSGNSLHTVESGSKVTPYNTEAEAQTNYLAASEVDDETGVTWGPPVHGLSLVDSQAFIATSGLDLSTYAGVEGSSTPYQIILHDSAGKVARGYIGAADAAITGAGNLIVNGSFTTDVSSWTAYGTPGAPTISSVASGQSGNCLRILENAGASPGVWQTFSVTPGKLYQFRFYVKAGDEATYIARIYDLTHTTWVYSSGNLEAAATWDTQTVVYFTAPVGCSSMRVYLNQICNLGAGTYLYFDTIIVQEITHVGATGVHIISTKDDSTRNWTSIESGFNYNDTAYTFEITRNLIETSGKILVLLPNPVQAKYVRVCIQSGSNVTLSELRPSAFFSAHEIVSGELHITDELSEAPLIRVTKSEIDRVKIGNLYGSAYGLSGYDENAATIFELSNARKQIAGWDFTATNLTNNNIYLSSRGNIVVKRGGDIFLESNASTVDKATLNFDSQHKIAAGTNSLGIWQNAATRVGFLIGAEPLSYTSNGGFSFYWFGREFDTTAFRSKKVWTSYVSNAIVGGWETYSRILQQSNVTVTTEARTILETSYLSNLALQTSVEYEQVADAAGARHIFKYTYSGSEYYRMFINDSGLVKIGDDGDKSSAIARLEVEDGGTSSGIVLKITQDDQNVTGLVIGNDSYSTTDLTGLRFRVLDGGTAYIVASSGSLVLDAFGVVDASDIFLRTEDSIYFQDYNGGSPIAGGSILLSGGRTIFYVGTNNVRNGSLFLFGADVTLGGVVYLYTSADNDAVIDYYNVSVVGAAFWIGPDTNPNMLQLTSDGYVAFGTWASSSDVAVNGYISIKDEAGNVRKLATIA